MYINLMEALVSSNLSIKIMETELEAPPLRIENEGVNFNNNNSKIENYWSHQN